MGKVGYGLKESLSVRRSLHNTSIPGDVSAVQRARADFGAEARQRRGCPDWLYLMAIEKPVIGL